MRMICCVCNRCYGAHNVFGYTVSIPSLSNRDIYGISVVVDWLAFIYLDLKKLITIEKSFYAFKWLSVNRLIQGFRARIIAGQS